MKKSKHRFKKTVAVMRRVNAVVINCINPFKRRFCPIAMSLVMAFMSLQLPMPTVHAANGWDEANHRRWVTCSTCGGVGSYKRTCSRCNGSICTEGHEGDFVNRYWSNCSGTSKACGQEGAHGSTHNSPSCPNKTGGNCGSKVDKCPYCREWIITEICDGTESVSCSTGSYQYDNTAPTLSLAKTIDADNPSYAGQAVTITATASDSLSGVYQYQFNGGTWQSGKTYVVPATAGSVTVTCNVKDNAGNISSTRSIAVKTIQNQAPLTISTVAPPTYGDSFTVSASGGTTGNPIVWSITSGNATISGNTVTTTGIGDIVIKAVMPGNSNYYDATATATVTVSRKPITAVGSLTADDKIYDGSTDAQMSGTLSLNGIINADTVQLSDVIANFNTADVGTNKAVTVSPFAISGVDAGNYLLTQPSLTGYSADVTAKNLTVTDTAVNDKIYDSTTLATYTSAPKLVGVVGSDDVAFTGGTPSFKTATQGTDKELDFVPFALSGAKKDNYTLTQPVLGTADITALQVTVADITVKDKIYDGTTTAEFESTPKLVGVKLGNDVTLVNGTPSFDNKNVGTGKTVSYTAFSLSGDDAENYSIVQPSTTTADVTKKPLTTKPITVQDKIYDATNTATIDTELVGIVTGDTVNLDFGAATFDTADVGTNKAVTVSPFAISGVDAGNYLLTQPTLTGYSGEITAKNLTVNDTVVNDKIYDSTTSASYAQSPKLVGVVGSDDVTFTGGTPSFKTATKGTDKELEFVPFALGGAKKGNYTLTQPVLGTADITALQVTVADITVKDKIYDGTTDAEFSATPKLSGVKSGDDVMLIQGTPSFDNKNVGSGKVVNLANFSITGDDAENYSIVQPSATTADVTKKPLTTKPITVQDKIYDATNTAAINTELVGIVTGDTVNLDFGAATFDTADVGTNKAVTVSPFAISGVDAGNYLLTQPSLTGYSGEITAKNAIVTPNDADKIYGEVDPSFDYECEGLLELDTLSGTLKRAPGEAAGEYNYTIDALTATDNYSLKLDDTVKFAINQAEGKATLAVSKSTTAPIDIILSCAVSGEDGNVEFYVLDEKVGTGKVKGGIATYTYKPLSIGNYKAYAKLTGSTNYKDATSDSVEFTVSISELTPPVLPRPPIAPPTSSTDTKKPTVKVPDIKVEVGDQITPKPVVPEPVTPPVVEVNSDAENKFIGYPEHVPDPWYENSLVQEQLDESVNPSDPHLIVIDVTDGMNLEDYSPLLSEQQIDKSVIGVYSAKLLLDGFEIEPNESVEITIPITGKLKEYRDHDIYMIGSQLVNVAVKSADAESISFDTDNLGYFAVVGAPLSDDNTSAEAETGNNGSSMQWILWIVGAVVLFGLFWLILLLLKRKKEKEEE